MNQVVGQKIRDARIARGLTQDELGDLIGKTSKTVSSYETGKRMCAIAELPALSEALDVEISYFFVDIVSFKSEYPEAGKYVKRIIDRPEWQLEIMESTMDILTEIDNILEENADKVAHYTPSQYIGMIGMIANASWLHLIRRSENFFSKVDEQNQS